MTDVTFHRRAMLTAMATAAFGGVAGAEEFCTDLDQRLASASRSSVPLGQMSDVLWGTALGHVALENPRYLDLVASEKPRFLAIANALKFDHRNWRGPTSLDGMDASSGWTECDEIVALATRLDIPVRGDCLAWNDWLPDWVKRLAKERPAGWRETLRDQFDNHFRSVFAHFDSLQRTLGKQPMRWCGVVNEPLNPWRLRQGVADWREGAWLDAFGIAADGVPGYIHRAFELAERHAPVGTTLFVNETFCEDDRFSGLVRPALLALVDALQRAGRNIGAVGLECHLMPQSMKDPAKPDWREYVGFLRELSKRGVAIYLTELDVNDCSQRDVADRDALVASYMRSFLTAALEVPAVSMVSNWGISDADSWWRESGVFASMPAWANCVARPACPRPTLYDTNMQPKLARDALAQALATRKSVR